MKRSFAALCLIFVADVSAVLAQTPTATISGQVRDASGAAIPGVRVSARNVQTNIEREAVTSENGDYTIPLLNIGEYQVSVEKQGFKRAVQTGLVLQVDQKARLDFSLQVGQVSESVEVTAATSLVQTDSASVGTVIDNKQVLELPLNSREFYGLALTAPRVLPPAQGSTLGFRGGFNVAGSSEVSNNFTLNGIDNNDTGINGPSFRPSIDAIQEFKLLSGIYSAEYGRNSGGQVVINTKSGTNQFHGTAYEFLRNQALDARNFFLRLKPGEKAPSFKRNLFGGSFGGPVINDKTFFFVSYEGLRLRQSVTSLATVPTPEMLNGDFSALRGPGPDQALGNADDTGRVLNPFTGREFARPNVIDLPLNPIGQELAKFFPAPTRATPAGAPTNNYNFSATRRENYNQISSRFDHSLSSKDSLYGTFNYYDNPAFEPSNSLCGSRVLPGFGCDTGLTTQLIGIVETHTFTSNLTNEVRLGFNRLRQPRIQEDDSVGFAGIPGAFFGETPFNGGVPQVSVTGFSTIGGATNLPQDRRDNTYQVVDNVIWTKSAHTLKFGGDIRRFQSNLYFISQGRGVFNFNATPNTPTSGNPFADLLLGLPTSTQRNPRGPSTYSRTSSFNFYTQDDWKVNSRLTLNLGLRWELNTPMTEKYNTIASFDPQTGQIRVAGQSGAPDNLFKYDYNNFAPRIGFAWQPLGDAKTVVRGGAGVFYNVQPAGNGLLTMLFNFPARLPQTFNSTLAAPITLNNPFPGAVPTTAPTNGSLTMTAIDENFVTAYITQWGMSVQREVGSDMVFEVGYLGSKGSHLPLNRNLNQATPGPAQQIQARRPYPQFGNITWIESVANSTYHSMELKAEKRYTKGLSLLASYTFSKSIDNSPGISTSSSASNAVAQDARDLAAERGLSDFDVRQRFVTSAIWEIPLGKGHKVLGGGPLAYIFGGWQASGILSLQTGRPFSATMSGDFSNTLNRNDRPNLIGDPNSGPKTVEQWFNKDAFQSTATGSFGTAGRNIITGPGFQNLDFALSRNFSVTERFRIQFRTELFNAFNHANFNYPGATFNASSFGQIASALDPRQIQFGLKIIF
ncbi:MAG TPA: carboxypeptidase regulatory-like domain-containing protein [Blastocatellia bacterium]|nr:carboxypeptidase regulatory-like domain-containing protein [Blastocatellia bacterium]